MSSITGTNRFGHTFYYYPYTGMSGTHESGVTYTNTKSGRNMGDYAEIVLYGTPAGGVYPEGTSKWEGNTVDVPRLYPCCASNSARHFS